MQLVECVVLAGSGVVSVVGAQRDATMQLLAERAVAWFEVSAHVDRLERSRLGGRRLRGECDVVFGFPPLQTDARDPNFMLPMMLALALAIEGGSSKARTAALGEVYVLQEPHALAGTFTPRCAVA